MIITASLPPDRSSSPSLAYLSQSSSKAEQILRRGQSKMTSSKNSGNRKATIPTKESLEQLKVNDLQSLLFCLLQNKGGLQFNCLMPNFPLRHGALRDLCASKKVQYSTRTTMAEIWLRTSSSYAKESDEREIPKDDPPRKLGFPGGSSLRFPD